VKKEKRIDRDSWVVFEIPSPHQGSI